MTPKDAAVEQYRRSERSLRTMARWAIQAGDLEGARDYLRLAQSVGIAFVREHRHDEPVPDEWERTYPLGRTA